MRLLQVRVIPNAKKSRILGERGRLKVYRTAPAIEGKANKALVEVLADHFGVRKSEVRIVKGEKGRDKVVEIDD